MLPQRSWLYTGLGKRRCLGRGGGENPKVYADNFC
jgi:hypothetical protein